MATFDLVYPTLIHDVWNEDDPEPRGYLLRSDQFAQCCNGGLPEMKDGVGFPVLWPHVNMDYALTRDDRDKVPFNATHVFWYDQ